MTDQQLLRDYTGRRSEAAFAELVRRHVDFVYSAALRMVRDPHLAEDVTQSVFVALAQNARQLTDHPVLSGWLHRTTQNLAANAVRSDVRRRAREQEAAAMNELLSAEPDVVWEHIAPHLDEALGELNEGDRDALLLRYFERKSAREIAQTLGTSEDAAQKRVSRAVERLREFFAKRGITVGASGLVVVITANAVQAAPVGLAATIATAAALAGTTLTTAATATATKAIAMTTLQKTLIAAALAAALATAFFLQNRSHQRLLAENLDLRQQTNLVQTLQVENERIRVTPPDPGALMALRQVRDERQAERAELIRLRAKASAARRDADGDTAITEAQRLMDDQNNWKFGDPNEFEFVPVEKRILPSSAQNSGSGTPEAALESWLWAIQQKDKEAWLNLKYTPEYRAAWALIPKIEGLEKQDSDRLENEFASLMRSLAGVKAVRLHTKELCGDGQLRLWFDFEREGEQTKSQPNGGVLPLKKIGDEWKPIVGVNLEVHPTKTAKP